MVLLEFRENRYLDDMLDIELTGLADELVVVGEGSCQNIDRIGFSC